MTNPKLQLQKWRNWIEIITSEVRDLVHYKEIFFETHNIIDANSDIHCPSSFYDFLRIGWVSFAAMAVRRQIKSKDGSISLCQLLEEIVEHPFVITLKSFADLYKTTLYPELAELDFKQFKSKEGDFVDSQIVRADLLSVRSSAKVIEVFADKRLAHRDRSELESVGTFDELHAAIETLHQVTIRYRLLFLAIGGSSLIPTHQYDWKAIFYHPWIKGVIPAAENG
jgi:hypothetical protein